jgi:hypothetical protein
MPYDPALPADHSDLNSQVMRNQLNALNDKIDAVPARPPHSPTPVPVLTVSGAAGAKAIS